MKDPNLLTTVAFREWNMEVGGGTGWGNRLNCMSFTLLHISLFFLIFWTGSRVSQAAL